MPLTLVDVVKRCRQGGAEHGDAQDECHQPERDPARNGRAGLPSGRRLVEAVDAGLVGYSLGGSDSHHGQDHPVVELMLLVAIPASSCRVKGGRVSP